MVVTRAGKIDDAEKISRVLALSWKTAYRGIVNDDYLDKLKDTYWVEFLTEGLKNGTVFSIVIEDDRGIFGAAILSRTEKECEVNLISFYLIPDKIGQGFGHIFYSAIESELKDREFSTCVVDVLESNARAISFYKAHGFVDTGRAVSTALAEQNYTCLVFEKPL
ncbi:MAG: GNAT family N-acetyltransferase [Oscillospiraceae bacterium]|jgi:ribosomal protein S18 acetylase RimI-like enzyme|nr:GNAT family N-acetyltransferase [Oscillospiraceae bacterium]